MRIFKPTLIFLSCLLTLSHADWLSWDFNYNPGFNTANSNDFYLLDTTRTDISGKTVSQVLSARTVVGDSVGTSLPLNYWYISETAQFTFKTVLYIDKLTLYSAQFLGITSSEAKVPTPTATTPSVMIGLGRKYDGPFFGLYAANGDGVYQAKDTIVSGLLTKGKSYLLTVTTSAADSIRAQLFDRGTGLPTITLSVPYQRNDYTYRGLQYFTVTSKGYQSDFGLGYADMRIWLDSLAIDAYARGTTSQSHPATKTTSFRYRIAPNPVSIGNSLQVFLDGAKNGVKATVKFYTLAGVLLRESKAELPCKLNTSYLPTGTYIIKTSVNGQTFSKPVLILK